MAGTQQCPWLEVLQEKSVKLQLLGLCQADF